MDGIKVKNSLLVKKREVQNFSFSSITFLKIVIFSPIFRKKTRRIFVSFIKFN